MNTKGLGVGEVFVYILAAVTFAAIMLFGYKAINSFLESGEAVEFVQFTNDLQNSILKIYSEYGAVRVKNFYVPGEYTQICFVDFEVPYAPPCTEDAIACAAWEQVRGRWDGESDDQKKTEILAGVEENVFLTPLQEHPRLKVHAIRCAGEAGICCFPIVNGRFELQLEGQGDATKVALPPVE